MSQEEIELRSRIAAAVGRSAQSPDRPDADGTSDVCDGGAQPVTAWQDAGNLRPRRPCQITSDEMRWNMGLPAAPTGPTRA